MKINISDNDKVYPQLDLDSFEQIENMLKIKRYSKGYWIFAYDKMVFTGDIDECLSVIKEGKIKEISVLHFDSYEEMQQVLGDLLMNINNL